MGYKILKPFDLRKMVEEEETAEVKAKKQAIEDLVAEILVKKKLNEFLEKNKSALLIKGTKVNKFLPLNQ
ncbi:hypothetical protein GQ568_02770, partial [Patescibacteria group bacterium]|nr:hypothetical protein [Patescibacteria group bacterium]